MAGSPAAAQVPHDTAADPGPLCFNHLANVGEKLAYLQGKFEEKNAMHFQSPVTLAAFPQSHEPSDRMALPAIRPPGWVIEVPLSHAFEHEYEVSGAPHALGDFRELAAPAGATMLELMMQRPNVVLKVKGDPMLLWAGLLFPFLDVTPWVQHLPGFDFISNGFGASAAACAWLLGRSEKKEGAVEKPKRVLKEAKRPSNNEVGLAMQFVRIEERSADILLQRTIARNLSVNEAVLSRAITNCRTFLEAGGHLGDLTLPRLRNAIAKAREKRF